MAKSTGASSNGGLKHPLLVTLAGALVSALIGAGATVWAASQGKLESIAPAPTVTITSPVPGPTTTTTVTMPAPSPSTVDPIGTTSPVDTAGDNLAELPPIAGRFRKGTFSIHALPFGDSLYGGIGKCDRKLSTTWNLARRYTRFNATIGLIDESFDATLKVRFTAYITDGTTRTKTDPVVLGKYQAYELKVPLNHADALELEAVMVGGADTCSGNGSAAWGDPRLYAS